jgi:DNA repair exonuclease SbcCD ATPase subunit
MYVEFVSMVINDFKTFKGQHALALNGSGVVYIVGENKVTTRLSGNGASKSTIWDALSWCLHGKTPLGLRTTDIKPWKGGKPFVTTLIVVDGVDYQCQRTTSPKNLFTVNGEERADISEVLPISFELFTNTILLPQERPLFFDLVPKDKMALIAEACDLERWDVRSAAASKAVETIEGEVNGFLNEQRNFEGKLEELGRTLSNMYQQSKDWNDKARSRTNVSAAAVKVLEKQLEQKNSELGTAVLAEDGALLELRHCQDEIERLGAAGLRAIGETEALQSSIERLQERIDEAEEDLAKLVQAKTCPTCGQPVKPINLKEHREHLREASADAAEAIKTKRPLLAKAKRLGEAIYQGLEQHQESVKVFRQKADDAEDVVLRLRPDVESLQRQIGDACKIKEEINPHLDGIRQLGERRKTLTDDLAEIKADIGATQAKAARTRFWVKAFKDIKLQLIEEVLQELELVANSMIEEIGLVDWEIRCEIEKESKSGTVQRLINVQIKSPESEGYVKWESWSGGERQRLKLVGSLALSDVLLGQVGIETNLEVLDEPAVYWASEGVQELCAFLATRAREREKTIFYIEHQAVESSSFSEVLTVVKDGQGAYILDEAKGYRDSKKAQPRYRGKQEE